jgi:O-antigen ligase
MNLNQKLIQFSSILFYLIPIALLTGPFLPDLFICIIGLVFIYISLKEKYFKYYKNNFFYFFVCFNFFIIISSLDSQFKLHSLESSLTYFRFGIFSLATWFLIDFNKNLIKNFTYIFISIFLIAIVDSYYQFYNGVNLFGVSTEVANRLVLLLNDKVYLGGYLSRLIPLLIGLIIFTFTKNKKSSYIFVCLLLILTDISIYLSGERTALGLLLICTLMIILLIKNFRILRLISLLTSIIIFFLISIYSPEIKERNFDKTYHQIFTQKKDGNIAIFSIHHESHILTSIRMFKDKPLIGHGPNTFRKLCSNSEYQYDELSCSTHPHNIYIQLLAETGLIGTTIFLLFPFSLIYLIIIHLISIVSQKKFILSDFQICIITCLVLTTFPFLPTQNFFNNYINAIFYLPLGFYLYSIYDKNLILNDKK